MSSRSQNTTSSNPNSGSYSYSTFQSTSYSSVTDSSGTRAEHTYTDPSGTTVTRAEKLPGDERAKYETKEYPAGRTVGAGGADTRGRIEDVSDDVAEEEEGQGRK